MRLRYRREEHYLDPAEPESLPAVPLPGGVRVPVLAPARDPHEVVRTAALGVVTVRHRLDVQGRGGGHLTGISWNNRNDLHHPSSQCQHLRV